MKLNTVLVIPPMRSPNTGRMLGWTASHALDCKWAANRAHQIVPYQQMRASDVPAHVGRCHWCGGGR